MRVVKLTDYEAYSVLCLIEAVQNCEPKRMEALDEVYRKICEAKEKRAENV